MQAHSILPLLNRAHRSNEAFNPRPRNQFNHSTTKTRKSVWSCFSEFPAAWNPRQKSLDYIHLLIERFPDDDKHQISKINGEYLMSTLMRVEGLGSEWKTWIDKAVASADAFLADHPNQMDVLETASPMRLNQCAHKATEEPEEYVQELLVLITLWGNFLVQDASHYDDRG